MPNTGKKPLPSARCQNLYFLTVANFGEKVEKIRKKVDEIHKNMVDFFKRQ